MLKIGNGPDSISLPSTDARVFYDASNPSSEAYVIYLLRRAHREAEKAKYEIERSIYERIFFNGFAKKEMV